MIHSMTGYGKAEALLSGGKLTVEIRTLNGKTADINLKSQILPKDKELEIRSRIAAVLVRGTIDVYLTWEADASASARQINAEIASSYLRGANELAAGMGLKADDSLRGALLCSVLRMPDVAEARKGEIFSEEDLVLIEDAFKRCLDMVEEYREKEGQVLYRDVTSRVAKILRLYDGVESFESERTANMRAKILKAAEDLGVKLDKERFEQEMIFYIEKLDINEEKHRLTNHLEYFIETLENGHGQGKKLGFISQEMGREINTLGSKSNHAEMQRIVVKMKDELEQIKEQVLNVM